MIEDKFWFFDISEGEFKGRSSIWLWALDNNGSVYVFVDPEFKNYFYIDGDVASLNDIRYLIGTEVGSGAKEIEVKYEEKVIGSSRKKFIKIEGPNESIKKIIQVFKRKLGEQNLYEDDIRYTNKYLMVNDLNPASWYEFSGEELYSKNGIKFYTLVRKPKYLEHYVGYPPLKTVSIDFVVASGYGEPDPKIDPVLMIVVYDGSTEPRFFELKESVNDYHLLKEFDRYIDSLDPHVIVTFGGNSIYWPYILNRCKAIRYMLTIGRLNIEVHQSLFGHISIAGRIHVDLKDYVEDIPALQRKTLEELAEFIGIEGPRFTIDYFRYFDYWRDKRDLLREYLKWRVWAIYNAFNLLKDHIFTLSNITGIPPDYVLTASSGRQAEFYIMRKAVNRGIIIPKALERRPKSYPGGLVLKPTKGLLENIAVIDYKSMYPSLIMKYNISPETLVRARGGDVEYFDEVGIGVRRDIKGLLPLIVEHLVEERDKVRKKIKDLERDSPLYNILNARQKVLKVLANTMYGYMGWLGARWYSLEGASLITYLGRTVISRSIEKAKELGLRVVYGDTDSLFVHYDEDKVGKLIKWIEDELGLEAKIDVVYKRLLFTEAKKRYAGLTTEGRIDIVGLEYVRRDWCDFARECQYRIIKMLLEGSHKDRLISEFRSMVNMLRGKKVPIEKLIIWEQITKPLNEYKANTPHIAVARSLARRGWRIRKGMFIGYIIVKGSGPLYKRAVHYLDVDPKDVDWDYYIKNQLLPVIARVLEPIGVGSKTLEAIVRSGGFGLEAFIR